MATTLRTVIEQSGSDFGQTPGGRSWCIKALHPADVTVDPNGRPDQSALRSLVLNYEVETRLACPPQAVSSGSWGIDAQLLPHPITLLYGKYTKGDGSYIGTPHWFEVLNDKVAGDTHADKFASLTTMASSYRMSYCSVTARLDCPSTDSQGTVVCCQRNVSPLEFTACGTGSQNWLPYPLPKINMWRGRAFTQGPDQPVYSRCSTPNHYSGDAKEGIYVPLHQDQGVAAWRTLSDTVTWTTRPQEGVQALCPAIGITRLALEAEAPHGSLGCVWFDNQKGVGCQGSMTCPFLNNTVADICFTNLSPKAAINMTFRFGLEVQVYPQSSHSGQTRVCNEFDGVALANYFSIVRQLKDAYPAAYNDWGKIWDVIKRAARAVAPVAVPLLRSNPFGAIALQAGRAVGAAIDKKAVKKKQITVAQAEKRGSTVSETDLARLKSTKGRK